MRRDARDDACLRPSRFSRCSSTVNNKLQLREKTNQPEHLLKMTEWSNQKILNFIEDYRGHPVLWCSKLKDYKVKRLRNAALQELSRKYECDAKTLKMKIKSLRSYFHKEHSKVMNKKTANTSENYVSNWFAYNALSFITETDDGSPQNNADTYLRYDMTTNEGHQGQDVEVSDDDDESFVQSLEDAEEVKYAVALVEETRSSEEEKKKERWEEDTPKVNEFQNLTKAARRLESRDEFTVFGEHVACKLRKLNDGRLQSIAEQQINNVLFNIEMKNVYPPRNSRDSNYLQSTIFVQPENYN